MVIAAVSAVVYVDAFTLVLCCRLAQDAVVRQTHGAGMTSGTFDETGRAVDERVYVGLCAVGTMPHIVVD